MSGVYGISVGTTQLPVYMNSSGQLGTLNSSRRYKTDIASMMGTERLGNLHPVTFHLKTDPNGPLQYGLIAEEVAKVFPELVVRDQVGNIASVRYDELAPILLRQMQLDHQRAQKDHEALVEIQHQLSMLQAAVGQGSSSLVAQR